MTILESYEKSWIVREDRLSAERLVSFAESFPRYDSIPACSVTVFRLEGSPSGDRVDNPQIETAKNELESAGSKVFTTGIVAFTFPKDGNANATIECAFPHGQLTVTVASCSDSDLAAACIAAVESAFPVRGPYTPGEIKEQAKQIQGLQNRVESLVKDAESLTTLQQACEAGNAKVVAGSKALDQISVEVQRSREAASASAEESKSQLADATRIAADVGNIKAQVEADKKTVQDDLGVVGSLEKEIKKFHSEITTKTKELANYKAQSEEITTKNKSLLEEIEEHLLLAAGASLFHAFDGRKGEIKKSKYMWAAGTVVAFLLQVAVLGWVAAGAKIDADGQQRTSSENSVTPANTVMTILARPDLWLRLSVSVPVVLLIRFCANQYSLERSREEIYAFKSALSLSLKPYLELAGEMDTTKKNTEGHANFVVETIRQIFEDPLIVQRAMEPKRDGEKVDDVMQEFARTVAVQVAKQIK